MIVVVVVVVVKKKLMPPPFAFNCLSRESEKDALQTRVNALSAARVVPLLHAALDRKSAKRRSGLAESTKEREHRERKLFSKK